MTFPLNEMYGYSRLCDRLRSSAIIWKQVSLRSSAIYDLRSAIVCDRLRSFAIIWKPAFILIFSLHCQLFLLISGCYTTCNIKITYQCKIIIIPEEGWFGQPKYSTHKKDPSTLCRLLLLFSLSLTIVCNIF